jgi:hypothetical protein
VIDKLSVSVPYDTDLGKVKKVIKSSWLSPNLRPMSSSP